MSTLVILRHAEAIPSKADDHARPLTPRGRADAEAVGQKLQALLPRPWLVLASDARRTMETAALACPSGEADVETRGLASLYDASPATLLQAVHDVAGQHDTVVVVGHNPGLSEFAKQLVGTGAIADRARVEAGLPTAGVAVFTFDDPWSAIAPRQGRLTATVAPDATSWPG
jgi:phosphohistidine phosphatase